MLDIMMPLSEAWFDWCSVTTGRLLAMPSCDSAGLYPMGNRMAKLSVGGTFGDEPEKDINEGLAALGHPPLDIVERGSSSRSIARGRPVEWALNLLVATDFDIFQTRKPMPRDPTPVKLTKVRCGHPHKSEHATLREALVEVDADVEHNTAAPRSLTVPTTLIGHPPVTFDAAQIYALLSLVRTED